MRGGGTRAVAAPPDTSPQEIVAVGGTASNLVKILPAAMLDRILTRDRVAEALAVLGSEPSAAAAERHLLNPVRSRILPAGAAIMDAVLERYGLDRIRVSEAGIREGAVLASQYDPIAWRTGWPSSPTGGASRDSELQPGDDPPERTSEADPGDAPPGLPDRAAQARDLALAADEVAPDRGALERRQVPGVLDEEGPCQDAETSASFINPRWSWRTVTRAMSGATSSPSASRTNSSV